MLFRGRISSQSSGARRSPGGPKIGRQIKRRVCLRGPSSICLRPTSVPQTIGAAKFVVIWLSFGFPLVVIRGLRPRMAAKKPQQGNQMTTIFVAPIVWVTDVGRRIDSSQNQISRSISFNTVGNDGKMMGLQNVLVFLGWATLLKGPISRDTCNLELVLRSLDRA